HFDHASTLFQGVDWWRFVDVARVAKLPGHWFGLDLDDPGEVASLEGLLAAPPGPQLWVVPILDEVRDPRPFLRLLQRCLPRWPGSRVIFGGAEPGLPDNRGARQSRPTNTREWLGDSFRASVEALGFVAEKVEVTETAEGKRWTVSASCTRESLDRARAAARLP